MYKANFYIGRKYIPGEIIRDTIAPEKLERLLKIGAVQEITAPDESIFQGKDILPMEDPVTAGVTDEVQDIPEGQESEELVNDETEAPEIDVMAGIVQEEAEKPKASSRPRKSTGRGKKN